MAFDSNFWRNFELEFTSIKVFELDSDLVRIKKWSHNIADFRFVWCFFYAVFIVSPTITMAQYQS